MSSSRQVANNTTGQVTCKKSIFSKYMNLLVSVSNKSSTDTHSYYPYKICQIPNILKIAAISFVHTPTIFKPKFLYQLLREQFGFLIDMTNTCISHNSIQIKQ